MTGERGAPARPVDDGSDHARSLARYDGQRATAGLILSEGTQPGPVGQGYQHTSRLHTGAPLDQPDPDTLQPASHLPSRARPAR